MTTTDQCSHCKRPETPNRSHEPPIGVLCPGHSHPHHVGDVCRGSCCTSCGGLIDENEACRCNDSAIEVTAESLTEQDIRSEWARALAAKPIDRAMVRACKAALVLDGHRVVQIWYDGRTKVAAAINARTTGR